MRTALRIDTANPTGYAQVLEEKAIANAVPITTYFLGLRVEGQADAAGNPIYLIADTHGSPREVVSATGATLARYSYDAFGNAISFDPDSAITKLLYNTERCTAELGQYYLRAHSYDPATGRFPTRDSYVPGVGELADWNGYVFVGGDAINTKDPSGFNAVAANFTVVSVMSAIAMGVKIVAPAALAATAGGALAYGILSSVGRAQYVNGLVGDLLGSGQASLVAAAHAIAGRTTDVVDAIDDAIDAAIATGKNSLGQLRKMKVFPVIKSVMPDIYAWGLGSRRTDPEGQIGSFLSSLSSAA